MTASAPARFGATVYVHPFSRGGYLPVSGPEEAVPADGLLSAYRELGLDHLQFYPDARYLDEELGDLLPWLAAHGIPFHLNVETMTSGPGAEKWFVPGTRRHDFSPERLDQARRSGEFLGVVYDECEHAQMHAHVAAVNESSAFYFADPRGLTLAEAHDRILDAMREITGKHRTAGTRWYGEHVFPVFSHLVARAGGSSVMKLLKEGYSVATGLLGLGAALQYDDQFWLTPDLWGPDSGPWFWWRVGMPGHSPDEYRSALKLAWWLGATGICTETVEMLAHPDGSGAMPLTAFGEVHRDFVRGYVPAHPRPYTFRDFAPEIAVLRYEDGYFGQAHCQERFRRGPFGGDAEFPESSHGWLDLWHLLSHGTIPRTALTWYAEDAEWSSQARGHGRKGPRPTLHTRCHPIFFPLPNVGWFDEQADARCLRAAQLIFLTGLRISDTAMGAVAARVRDGATAVAQSHLLPDLPGRNFATQRDGRGLWVRAASFLDDRVRELVAPHLGRPDEIRLRFADTQVVLTAESGDRNRLACNLD